MLAKKKCQQVKFIGVSLPTQKCEPQTSPKERFPYPDAKPLQYALMHLHGRSLRQAVGYLVESQCGAPVWEGWL